MPAKKNTEIAISGLKRYYEGLSVPQLAFYHRVPRILVQDWKEGRRGPPEAHEIHRDVVHIGALGSGKSVGGFFTAIALSCLVPDNLGIIVRKRWEELKNHVIDEMFRLADEMTDGNRKALMSDPKAIGGSYEITVYTLGAPSKIIVKPEPDGTDRAIEDSFKGPEFGWFLLDEQTQLREATWETLRGRLRRQFPHLTSQQASMLWAGLSMSNPPFAGHWLADNVTEVCQELEAKGDLTTEDPLILRSRMDDNPHLPKEYISAEKRKYRNDPIRYRMYIEGQDGLSIDGRPVFGDTFRGGEHTSKELKYNPFLPLVVGLDFGWHHPAAVFLQQDQKGCVNILGELIGQEETAEDFGGRVLDYIKQVFPKVTEVIYFGDPAGAQQSDKGDPTIVILARLGIRVGYRHMLIDPGLDLIRQLLGTLRGSRPRLMFHPDRCPVLVKAFIGGYHYKQGKGGVSSPKPHKDGFYDHPVDALRYALGSICGEYFKDDKKNWPKFAKGAQRKEMPIW